MNFMEMKRHMLICFFHIHVGGVGKRNEEVIRMEGVIRGNFEEVRLVNLFFHIYAGG
jgi:hypothetical protein